MPIYYPDLVFEDWLYIGSYDTTRNKKFIDQQGITHIFSAIGPEAEPYRTLTYGSIDIEDSSSQELNVAIRQCCEFILATRRSSRTKVLVHCAMGVSRSVALVMGYLIIHHRMASWEALATIVKSRPHAFPHYEFREQLRRLADRVSRGETDPLKTDLIVSVIESVTETGV